MITLILQKTRVVQRSVVLWMLAGVILGTMTACDSGSVDESTSTTPLTVSFTTASASSSPAAATLSKRSVSDAAGNALEFTRVEMILEKVEFEREGNANACREDREDDSDGDDRDDGEDPEDEEDDGEDDDCEEVETGPFVLDLPLTDSAPQPALTTALPEGRWSEVEFEIEPLDDDDVTVLNTSVPVDASIRVEGQFTPAGEAPVSFVWIGDVEEEQEIEFEPPVTVTADNPVNVTFRVDIDDWFRMDDGTLIDPREAIDDSDLEDIVEDNIEDSIEGFQDDDRDGEDDDEDAEDEDAEDEDDEDEDD